MKFRIGTVYVRYPFLALITSCVFLARLSSLELSQRFQHNLDLEENMLDPVTAPSPTGSCCGPEDDTGGCCGSGQSGCC
jgi:hypothetical protein